MSKVANKKKDDDVEDELQVVHTSDSTNQHVRPADEE